MKFSVLVPVYNVSKFLDQCINSILDQSYSDYELILVDDGSTDNSGEICDSYSHDSRVKVIHKTNGGLISARRSALKASQGEYIVFCDSDDFLEKDALQKIQNIINKFYPDVIFYNAYIYKDDTVHPFFSNIFESNRISDKKIIYDKLFLSYEINSLCCKACKRNVVDIDADYSGFYNISFGEDFLQSAPIYKAANSFYYLDDFLYYYRYSSGMMRQFNKNYYYSYKAANIHVVELLKYENIIDLNQKAFVHLLHAAYGHFMQYKLLKKIPIIDFDNIRNDEYFQEAVSNIAKVYKRYIPLKEQIVLEAAKNNNIMLIRCLIRIAKLRNKSNESV